MPLWAGLLLGACSGSHGVVSRSSVAPQGRSTSPSRTHSSSSSTSSTPNNESSSSTTPSPPQSPSSSQTTAPGRCHSSELVPSVVRSGVAAGTVEVVVAFTNVSSLSCDLYGYPGMQMVSSLGDDLPTDVVRGGPYAFTNLEPTPIKLAPQGRASFVMGFNAIPQGDQGSCPRAASLEITPPNAYHTVVLDYSIAPCDGGKIAVSPVQAGVSPS